MTILLDRLCRAAAVIGCCLLVSACGGQDQPAATSGQVVARVGEQVVTTQELDSELRLANIPPDRQKDPAIIKQVLGELVTRKYLLQQALAAKLDREPSVLLDLLRAREKVLESAMVSRAVGSKAPGRADLEKYVANNPSKFAKRQIFSVEQIAFQLTPATQSIIDANKNANSLDEIDRQLTAAGIPHGRQMGVVNSADIPPDFYSSIVARKADDVFFVRAGPNGVFFKVRGEEARPLEGEAAVNAARQLMRAEALKAETSLASYSANLEAKYEGVYSNIMKTEDNSAK